ncbi:MAG: endonuclease/exonuclease/phosphatase family protein [Kiritimatiellae bacterium]|nr:endonuclease/exonuclease/phosphatase family protein [Kiritimatiellia bacterium]
MSWNLRMYSIEDRDGDGQRTEPKPPTERAAISRIIARCRPHVLAVQEIGISAVLDEFRRALQAEGLVYPHLEHLIRPDATIGLAVLSRLPIVARRSRLDDVYRIGTTNLPVLRGFIDVELQTERGYRFRLFVVHLKSKVYHPLGQTEMRRNEARIIAQHVHSALQSEPGLNLLLLGDLNDSPDSAPVQRLLGEDTRLLHDLRPSDDLGDVWTHFSSTVDIYSRIDYALVSAGMLGEVVREKCRVVRDPDLLIASDHRPLLVVVRATDAALTAR